jgi:hypothetical protein
MFEIKKLQSVLWLTVYILFCLFVRVAKQGNGTDGKNYSVNKEVVILEYVLLHEVDTTMYT